MNIIRFFFFPPETFMRVCKASRCRFDTQWEVFSQQQEMADVDRGPITASLDRSRHVLLRGY